MEQHPVPPPDETGIVHVQNWNPSCRARRGHSGILQKLSAHWREHVRLRRNDRVILPGWHLYRLAHIVPGVAVRVIRRDLLGLVREELLDGPLGAREIG